MGRYLKGGEKGSDPGYVSKVVEIWSFKVLMRDETFRVLALDG